MYPPDERGCAAGREIRTDHRFRRQVKKGQLDEIKNYCVNPVDSQIAENEKPETLDMEMTVPEDVATIEGFRDYAPDSWKAIAGKWDLP